MEYNFEALSEETRELAESSVIVSNAVREANKAFDAGATSSDKLSSVIAGANAQFLNNKANIAAYAEEIKASICRQWYTRSDLLRDSYRTVQAAANSLMY